jgi:TonB family protein
MPPRVVEQTVPIYPDIAQEASISGVVALEVTVDETGRVSAVGVIKSVPLLEPSALTAARQLKFTPGNVAGTPVAVTFPLTFQFVLEDRGNLSRPFSTAVRAVTSSGLLPPDFAIAYSYYCPRSEVFIDTTKETIRMVVHGEPPRRVTVEAALTTAEQEAIFMNLVKRGFFAGAEGVTTWREVIPRVTERDDGMEIRVVSGRPVVHVSTHRTSFHHLLDIRYYGNWKRAEWDEPLPRERSTPEHLKEFSAIGEMIRQIVERQEAIKALPRDQRSCG